MTTGNYDGYCLDPGVSEYMTSIIHVAENFMKSFLKIVAEKKILSFEKSFKGDNLSNCALVIEPYLHNVGTFTFFFKDAFLNIFRSI